jgi:hypothetical protein
MERSFMEGASVEERAGLQTWLDSIDPRRTNVVSVAPGEHNDSSIPSVSGPTGGETPNAVAGAAGAAPVMAEAVNEGPPPVAAPAVAEGGNHEGGRHHAAAPATVEVRNAKVDRSSDASCRLDYSTIPTEATGSLVGVALLDGSNVESGGGTMDPTRSDK